MAKKKPQTHHTSPAALMASMPTLQQILNDAAADMNAYDGIAYGIIDIAAWLPLIQGLFSMFAQCPKKKNPQPTPPAGISQEQWDKAYDAKAVSERGFKDRRHSYKRGFMERGVNQIMADAETHGKPVTYEFAESLTKSLADQARELSMPVLATAVKELKEFYVG